MRQRSCEPSGRPAGGSCMAMYSRGSEGSHGRMASSNAYSSHACRIYRPEVQLKPFLDVSDTPLRMVRLADLHPGISGRSTASQHSHSPQHPAINQSRVAYGSHAAYCGLVGAACAGEAHTWLTTTTPCQRSRDRESFQENQNRNAECGASLSSWTEVGGRQQRARCADEAAGAGRWGPEEAWKRGADSETRAADARGVYGMAAGSGGQQGAEMAACTNSQTRKEEGSRDVREASHSGGDAWVEMSASEMKQMGLLDLPILEAARRVSQPLSMFKSTCRRVGIRRWPQRTRASIHKLLQVSMEKAPHDTGLIQRLQDQLDKLTGEEGSALDADIAALRQAVYKARYQNNTTMRDCHQSVHSVPTPAGMPLDYMELC